MFEANRHRNYAALCIRGAWHAAGTYDSTTGKYGSNGGTMRFESELSNPGNEGVDEMVYFLEPVYETARNWGTPITHGDLYTFCGVVAVQYMGGPKVEWLPGRIELDESHAAPKDSLPDPDRDSEAVPNHPKTA